MRCCLNFRTIGDGALEQVYDGYTAMNFSENPIKETIVKDSDGADRNPETISLDRICRICHGHEVNDPQMGRLLSPCKCRGSMKYVHLGCLNSWREISKRRESFWQCENCNYRYNLRRTTWAKYLQNELMTQLLTFLIFLGLVFVSGYFAKFIIYIFSDADDNEIIVRPAGFPLYADTYGKSFSVSLWKPDWDHMVIGVYSVGALGFFYLFASFFRNPFGPFPNLHISSRGTDNRAGYMVFGLFILIGIVKILYAIYRGVKKISQRFLSRLETVVLDVND
jgi:hypothetical protein